MTSEGIAVLILVGLVWLARVVLAKPNPRSNAQKGPRRLTDAEQIERMTPLEPELYKAVKRENAYHSPLRKLGRFARDMFKP
jgi:hypothetical protein